MDTENKYIYKCSWFKSKRHRISHTDMYFLKPEETHWIYETSDWFVDLVEIQYIMCSSTSPEYRMALNNSLIATKTT